MAHIKERLQMYGASTLSTAELVAYLFSSGTERSVQLVKACKLLETLDVKELRNADVADLQGKGLSEKQAQRLHAVCELAQRFSAVEPPTYPQIRSADDAAAILRPLMMHLEKETFRVLLLNTKNYVIANLLLYTGTINSSVLRAAEVYKPAIARNCPSIIVAHNHPSSNIEESPEDRAVTMQLVAAGKVLDIELLDHLIIGNPRYLSLKERMGGW